MGYQAVRGERWKYIHYTDLDGMDELYDLKADPYEMNNLGARPETGETLAQMRGKLQQVLDSSR
jgi:N-acetylglucosamine-6-sulfatase